MMIVYPATYLHVRSHDWRDNAIRRDIAEGNMVACAGGCNHIIPLCLVDGRIGKHEPLCCNCVRKDEHDYWEERQGDD